MKLCAGLLILLLAVAGCSYQGEDPQGASSPDNEKASDGTAAPAVPTPPAEGSETTGTAKTVKKPDAETEKPAVKKDSGLYSPDEDPLVNPDSLFEKVPQDPEKIARDETLVRHLKSDPATLHPLFTSSIYESYVEDTVFDSLFTFDREFNWIVNESMVASMNQSEDHKTWTVKLRPGLKWHDGHPLTAHDVAFTWEAIMDPAVPTKTLRSGRDQLESVTALDDLTVQYVHKEALATSKWNMLYSLLPKHILDNPEERKKNPDLQKGDYYLGFAKNPVGCGPYKFVKDSWVRKQQLVVERWDDYHGQKPNFKRQVFKIISDMDTALNLFKKGGLDEIQLSTLQFATQTNDEDFGKLGVKAFNPTWTYYFTGWNTREGSNHFFTDRRVRQAMAYAANIPLVLKKLTYGLSRQASGIFQPGSWMHNDQVKLFPYDLEKAGALLDEAGWKINDSDGARYKEIDGEKVKFEFTLLIPQGSTLAPGFAAIFREDLAQLGIDLKQQTMDFSALLKRIRTKDFDAFTMGWGTGVDPDTIGNIWKSDQAEKGRNYISYSNPDVDRLHALQRREFDPGKRAGFFKEIHRLIYEDQPYLFLNTGAATWAFHKRIRGVTFSPRGVFSVSPSHLDWWVSKEEKLR